MLNIKNAFLLIVGTVFLLIVISVTNFRQNMVVVVADKNDFTDADYTDSDYLLQSNGRESNKTISAFVSEVKAAPNGTQFVELAEVIPAQYLNSTEPNAVYQYNGKEYGFYVVKETVA